jgi:hypothetical protein
VGGPPELCQKCVMHGQQRLIYLGTSVDISKLWSHKNVYKTFINADFSLVDGLYFNCFCRLASACRSTVEESERKHRR